MCIQHYIVLPGGVADFRCVADLGWTYLQVSEMVILQYINVNTTISFYITPKNEGQSHECSEQLNCAITQEFIVTVHLIETVQFQLTYFDVILLHA